MKQDLGLKPVLQKLLGALLLRSTCANSHNLHIASLSCHWAALRGAWSCLLYSLSSDIYAPVPSLFQSEQSHIKFQQLLWSHCLHSGDVLVLVLAAVGPWSQVSICLKFIGNANPCHSPSQSSQFSRSLELLPKSNLCHFQRHLHFFPWSGLFQAQQKPGAIADLQCLVSRV